jgi:hypothetical protein
VDILTIHLLDRWGRQAEAELVVRRDTVEMRCRDVLVGVANRDYLRQWLRNPEGVYVYDDMSWMVTGNGIALSLGDVVPSWPLEDHVLAGIRERV